MATPQPAPAATSAAAVEMLNVEGPPPVPAVSTRSVREVSTEAESRRIVRARPTSSATVSPFARRAIRKAPVCTSPARPSITSSRTAEAWSAVRWLPDGELVDRAGEDVVGHGGGSLARGRPRHRIAAVRSRSRTRIAAVRVGKPSAPEGPPQIGDHGLGLLGDLLPRVARGPRSPALAASRSRRRSASALAAACVRAVPVELRRRRALARQSASTLYGPIRAWTSGIGRPRRCTSARKRSSRTLSAAGQFGEVKLQRLAQRRASRIDPGRASSRPARGSSRPRWSASATARRNVPKSTIDCQVQQRAADRRDRQAAVGRSASTRVACGRRGRPPSAGGPGR